ncbi:MAG: siderophore-interacting protein [Bifidobacterium psychraerophilum]|uniref:siderophore-interacting protein n=1 Tax=Bifidobacterium psychraerophilum TaxID=218140 RepID=UPI0039E9E22A
MSTSERQGARESEHSGEQYPAFRPYRVRVLRTTRISPSFQRIIFTGDDLRYIGTDGYDQRIKVLLPLDGNRWGDPKLFDEESLSQGAWWEQWRALAPQDRNPIRTYTIRAADPVQRNLTIDFVLHDNPGPAGAFAQHAVPGDEAVIVGPDRRSKDSAIGIDFHPGYTRNMLLVGDETAVPAIGAILDGLAASGWEGKGLAVLEVPDAADTTLALPRIPGFGIDWVSRSSAEDGPSSEHGASLIARVERYAAQHADMLMDGGSHPHGRSGSEFTDINVDRDLLWEVPEEQKPRAFYAWMAGEAATMRTLRRILVRDHGVDRSNVAFMGYWRAGKSEM